MDTNNTNNFVRTMNYKKVALYGGLAVVALLLIVFWLTNSIVYLTVTNNAGGSVTTAAIVGDEIKPVGGGGLLVVPRSATGLIVSTGDSGLTQTNIDLPLFGFASKTVQIDAGKKAKQVSFQGSEPICVTYSQSADRLLHYNCEDLKELVSTESVDNKQTNKKVADLQYISGQTLPAYNGGVLGIAESAEVVDRHGEKEALVRFTSANGAVSYEAPSQINASNLTGLRVFTDTSNPQNNHFILVDIFGVIYLGSVSEDGRTATYKRVEAPTDYSYRFNQTFCAIKDESAYCYRGKRDIQDQENAVKTKPAIVQLSFSDGEVSSKVLENAPLLDSLYVTASSVYGTKGTALYALGLVSDKYTAQQLAQYVERVASGQKLYFVKSNGVHEVDDKTHDSRRIFYSPGISVRGFYPAGDKLFVFGQTRIGGSTVYAYQLQ